MEPRDGGWRSVRHQERWCKDDRTTADGRSVEQGADVGEPGGVMPPVVMRGRRVQSEAARDREMLRWIGRFRFVTVRS